MKKMLLSIIGSSLLTVSLSANFDFVDANNLIKLGNKIGIHQFDENYNIVDEKNDNIKEIKNIESLIIEYKNKIKRLKDRNVKIDKKIAENPKKYEIKKLEEENDKEYIYRIKLNGAEVKNLNMKIQNNYITISMEQKTEKKDNGHYFMSSSSFLKTFQIPQNVEQSKITNDIDGDYFIIKMPKVK